jgi:transcription elongation factor Elf1
MICEYDYTCPYCGATDNVTTSCQAPDVGDTEKCRHCNKVGKIVYAKLVYDVEKINNERKN